MDFSTSNSLKRENVHTSSKRSNTQTPSALHAYLTDGTTVGEHQTTGLRALWKREADSLGALSAEERDRRAREREPESLPDSEHRYKLDEHEGDPRAYSATALYEAMTVSETEDGDADCGAPEESEEGVSEDEEFDPNDYYAFLVQPAAEAPPADTRSVYEHVYAAVLSAESEQSAAREPPAIRIERTAEGKLRIPKGARPDAGRPKKRYKPVAIKVKPTSEKLPEDFRVVRKRPLDCMDTLPELPVHPTDWKPSTAHLSEERMRGFGLDENEFLQPEERKLFKQIIEHHQSVFAWEESERRRFKPEYFDPIKYPIVPHEPWEDKHHPIPPGVRDQLIRLLKAKIATGVYEPSSSSYRSGWFCVMKKDGKSLRIVHNLQRLNSVTIRDAGTLPTPDEFSETCAGRTVIGALDQFSSYDLQLVHPDSRDYTTFQTPLGPYRIVSLPMGWTNSVAIQHGNLVFILQPEMPEHCAAFIDDIFPLGPRSFYKDEHGVCATIAENQGIRQFIWEYAQVLNRVLQRLDHSGASVSGKKALIAVSSTLVTGYTVSFEGRTPHQSNVQRVLDWPACESVRDVRAFLGTAGLSRLWIRNFALLAKPLTTLVKKGTVFNFDDACHMSMYALKVAVANARCLRPVDYESGREVILAVDSSVVGVGFIIMQLGEDGRRYPARYNSITWNEREARYSQAKLELHGLFRALKSSRIWLFQAPGLVVEVDAKYIKGMLNNPDVQPNATINRWIAGILLFHFTLRHVPADKHTGADGLSRRRAAPGDPVEDDDPEEWLDRHLCRKKCVSWV